MLVLLDYKFDGEDYTYSHIVKKEDVAEFLQCPLFNRKNNDYVAGWFSCFDVLEEYGVDFNVIAEYLETDYMFVDFMKNKYHDLALEEYIERKEEE